MITSIETVGGNKPLSPALENLLKGKSTEALETEILGRVESKVAEVIGQRLMPYTDSLMRSAEKKIEEFEGKLAGIHQQVIAGVAEELTKIGGEKILSIKIGEGQIRKLKTTASPYLPEMIANALNGLHTLLVGPAGCGKTHMAEQLAEALGRKFYCVSLTAGASESWLLGRQTPTGFVPGAFYEAYKNGGVFLADEIDAADANMLLVINASLANGHLYNPINGEFTAKHKDFVFIAAANTHGKGGNSKFTGRVRLDEATRDRLETIDVDYNTTLEKELCPDKELLEKLWSLRVMLQEREASETVSTRRIISAYKRKVAGIDESTIFGSLVSSWSEDLKKEALSKIGVEAKKGVMSFKARK